MKKMKQLVFTTMAVCIFLTSCKKESLHQDIDPTPRSTLKTAVTEKYSSGTSVADLTDGSSQILSNDNVDVASRCPTQIEAVGLAYSLQPIGAFGTILSFDITYYNTAPNGYFNIYVREPGMISGTPIWKSQHFVPAQTGGGYDVIHFSITLLPFVTIPVELAIQGVPGVCSCRNTKRIFSIN